MISSNNLKQILTGLFNKNKEEHDKDINHLKTNMNKGWISSGTIDELHGVSDASAPFDYYSEDELLIGQWIDGKPLYRKVVKLTCPSTQTGTRASTYIDLSDLNIDSYVNCTSYLANYGILPASYNGAAANYYSVIDRFNLNRVAIESNWADHNNKQIISIIEYTKTTDEPFSVDEDIAFIALDSEVDEIINRLGE